MSTRDGTAVVMVWFRAEPRHDDAVVAALAQLMRRLREEFGVQARIGRRDEPGKPYRTWLETYEPLPAGRCERFAGRLAALAEAYGLPDLSLAGRHLEIFQWIDG